MNFPRLVPSAPCAADHGPAQDEGARHRCRIEPTANVLQESLPLCSMEASMGVTFPNESPEYRKARDKLLRCETALRREMEAVAAELRALPPGGAVPQDYAFDHIGAAGAPAKVRLSELFRPGTETLILYHFMFPRHCSDKRRGPAGGPASKLPLAEGPCPSCTALLDNWEGAVPHVEGLGVNIAAVAKAPIERVAAFAAHRGWRNLKLLSAVPFTYGLVTAGGQHHSTSLERVPPVPS